MVFCSHHESVIVSRKVHATVDAPTFVALKELHELGFRWMCHLWSNVRGHRADEMNETIRYAASEAPGGPRG